MLDVDAMIEWENGELNLDDTLDLFAGLVRDGTAWTLQGTYGRTAAALIEGGYITADGEVNQEAVNAMMEATEG